MLQYILFTMVQHSVGESIESTAQGTFQPWAGPAHNNVYAQTLKPAYAF